MESRALREGLRLGGCRRFSRCASRSADGSPDLAHRNEAAIFLTQPTRARAFSKTSCPANSVAGPIPKRSLEMKNARIASRARSVRAITALLTQSDDRSRSSRARRMALRAAQRAPTVPRTLLAASLVENRNRAAIGSRKRKTSSRAAAQATTKKWTRSSRARVTSARERTGATRFLITIARSRAIRTTCRRLPRAWSSTAKRICARPRSRITERAVARRPQKRRALVRAMVDLLRQEDRTTEADEMEARYSALPSTTRASQSEDRTRPIARRDRRARRTGSTNRV